MNWIFFASVTLFIWLFGLCRRIMLEANKNAKTHKTHYDDTNTLYLDGRPYTPFTDIYSRYKRVGKGVPLQDVGNN